MLLRTGFLQDFGQLDLFEVNLLAGSRVIKEEIPWGELYNSVVQHEQRIEKPRTAPRGKRYKCAICRKRSPQPVLTPAPWYCPKHEKKE
jgi:hypothetical protein